jgi:hypothetical protein
MENKMNLENNEEFQELTDEQKEVVKMLLDGNGYTDISSAMMAYGDVTCFGNVTKTDFAKEELVEQAESSKDVRHLLPYIDYKSYGNDTYMDYTEYNGKLYLIP